MRNRKRIAAELGWAVFDLSVWQGEAVAENGECIKAICYEYLHPPCSFGEIGKGKTAKLGQFATFWLVI